MAKQETITCDCGCDSAPVGKLSMFVNGAIINVDVDLCEAKLREMASLFPGTERVGQALDKKARNRA